MEKLESTSTLQGQRRLNLDLIHKDRQEPVGKQWVRWGNNMTRESRESCSFWGQICPVPPQLNPHYTAVFYWQFIRRSWQSLNPQGWPFGPHLGFSVSCTVVILYYWLWRCSFPKVPRRHRKDTQFTQRNLHSEEMDGPCCMFWAAQAREYLPHGQSDAHSSSKTNWARCAFGKHGFRTHNSFSEVFFSSHGGRTEPERNSWSDLFIHGLSHKPPRLILDWEEAYWASLFRCQGSESNQQHRLVWDWGDDRAQMSSGCN